MKTLATPLFLFLFGLAPAAGAEMLRVGVNPGYPPVQRRRREGRLKVFDIALEKA